MPTSGTISWRVSLGLWLRGLAAIYVVAFLSLGVQVTGLVGEHGILPLGRFLAAARGAGAGFADLPSLFWLGDSDAWLTGACAGGALAAAAALFGLAPWLALAVAWFLYLSLVGAGQDFLGFQWDALLLEAGALALCLCPPALTLRRALAREVPALTPWLPRLLLLKLMLQSGYVKLASGDRAWRDLSALKYHFETQPLPNPVAWLAGHLPSPALTAGVVLTFVVELLVPFLILGPRRLRLAALLPLVGLQVLILLTGNYGFFNLLTLVLCFALVDDRALGRPAEPRPPPSRVRRLVVALGFALSLALGLGQSLAMTGLGELVPAPLAALERAQRPFQLVGRYGLFAVMTTERLEIELEASLDGQAWEAYRFRDKVGPLDRAPPETTPHMPRLDWQMWFAALGPAEASPWLTELVRALLEGSAPVLALLDEPPLAGRTPRFVRATLYRYRFSSFADWRASGLWWRRERVGDFLPPLALKAPAAAAP